MPSVIPARVLCSEPSSSSIAGSPLCLQHTLEDPESPSLAINYQDTVPLPVTPSLLLHFPPTVLSSDINIFYLVFFSSDSCTVLHELPRSRHIDHLCPCDSLLSSAAQSSYCLVWPPMQIQSSRGEEQRVKYIPVKSVHLIHFLEKHRSSFSLPKQQCLMHPTPTAGTEKQRVFHRFSVYTTIRIC